MTSISKTLYAIISLSSSLSLANSQNLASDHMIVTATRSSESIAFLPSTVQIIDDLTLQKYATPGENLGSLLGKLVPGLGMPTQSVTNFGQTIRGRDILIVIDGIPQNENRQISRQLNSINAQTVERIEIVSGASAVYGVGAAGGIIHIFTKEASTKPLSSHTLLGTSVATKPLAHSSQAYQVQQTLSGSQRDIQYVLSLGFEERQNEFDAKGEQIAPEPAQTSRGDSQSFDVLAKLAYNIDLTQKISLNLQAFQEQQDTTYVTATNPYRAISGLELEQQPASERYQAVLDYQNHEFFAQNLTVKAFYRQRHYRFFPFVLTQPVAMINQSYSQATIFGLKTTIHSEPLPQLSINWGIDLEEDRGKQTAVAYDYLQHSLSGGRVYKTRSSPYDYGPEVETQKIALFSQLKWDWSDEFVSRFGLRLEQIRQQVHAFTPPLETALAQNWGSILSQLPEETASRLPGAFPMARMPGDSSDFQALAFNIGLVYQLSPQQNIYWNASQGYELADTARLMRDAVSPDSLLPSLLPIFDPDRTIQTSTLQDLDLNSIQTSNIEIGWRASLQSFFASAAVFYNESDKVYRFNPDFTVSLLEQKKRIYGFETQYGWRPYQSLTMGGSLSFAAGEYRDTQTGRWLGLSTMEVSPPKWSLYSDLQWSQRYNWQIQLLGIEDYKRDFRDSQGIKINGYHVVDTSLASKISDRASLRLSISNLLNRDYKTVYHQWAEATYGPASGAPASGRRLSLVYQHEF
ncbi:MAG: TonB-dependent receptor [Oligoflexus sp.]